MRLVIILFLLVLLCFEGVLFVVFTAPGNAMLVPVLNRYLSQKVPQAKIVIQKMRLKPDAIGVIAKINDTIDLKARGDIDLLTQGFDINYTIQTQEIKTVSFTIKEPISIYGNARGTPEKMKVHGKGLAFKSKLRYGLSLLEKIPSNIKIDIQNADLKSLLATARQKPYATGRVSLHANMPSFTPLNPQVDAVFSITQGHINSVLIHKDFNLTLPAKTSYKTHFILKSEGGRLLFNGSVNSSLVNLALKEGKYHLLSNTLASDYLISIPDMHKLSSLSGMPMKGTFTLNGTMALKQNKLSVEGNTKSFGGKIHFVYAGDSLNATLAKVNNSLLLSALGQPSYLSGETTATLTLTSIKHLSGDFSLQSKGQANRKVVKKVLGLDLGKKFLLNTALKGSLKKHTVLATLSAKTSMANLKSTAIHYDIPKASLKADYHIDIPNMAALQPLTGKAFKGDMQINGNIKQSKDLLVTGKGKEFGGTIDFTLRNDKLTANVKGATVSKIMTMLDYPQVLEAISQADVVYNLTSASGTLHAKLDNARILPSQLTTLLKQFKIIDLSKERFNNSKFDAKITKKRIDFSLDARNKNNFLVVKNGRLIKKTEAIDAKVAMKIRGKDLQASIKGTLQHPKVSLDGSAYLKNKIKEKIKKKYGKKIEKAKKKVKDKLGEKATGLIKGLF